MLPSCRTPRLVFRECPRFKPTNIRLQPQPEARSRGAGTTRSILCDPQATGLLLQHLHRPSLGACSSQTPKCPAAWPQVPGLLHALTLAPVLTDRICSPDRAAPAQAAFHARIVPNHKTPGKQPHWRGGWHSTPEQGSCPAQEGQHGHVGSARAPGCREETT